MKAKIIAHFENKQLYQIKECNNQFLIYVHGKVKHITFRMFLPDKVETFNDWVRADYEGNPCTTYYTSILNNPPCKVFLNLCDAVKQINIWKKGTKIYEVK